MHDALYANGGRFADADLVALADRIGLDVERFRADLADGRARRARRARRRRGARASRRSPRTPAFFVNGRAPRPTRSTPVRWSRHSRPIRHAPTNLAPPMPRVRRACSPLVLALLVAACGGGDKHATRRRDPVAATCPTRTASATRVKAASTPTRPSSRPRDGKTLAAARRRDGRRPVAGAGDARSSPRGGDEPDGVRHDRPGRHAGLRADGDLRRARRRASPPRARSSRPPTCC